MNHDRASSSLVRGVVGVGEADVEREVKGAAGIELSFGNVVESFRNLVITFPEFGPEIAGGSGDGVGFEEEEFLFVCFDPKFEDGFFLEGANEDGGAPGELIFLEAGFEAGSDFFGDGRGAFGAVGVFPWR